MHMDVNRLRTGYHPYGTRSFFRIFIPNTDRIPYRTSIIGLCGDIRLQISGYHDFSVSNKSASGRPIGGLCRFYTVITAVSQVVSPNRSAIGARDYANLLVLVLGKLLAPDASHEQYDPTNSVILLATVRRTHLSNLIVYPKEQTSFHNTIHQLSLLLLNSSTHLASTCPLGTTTKAKQPSFNSSPSLGSPAFPPLALQTSLRVIFFPTFSNLFL
jgi:hypothetical protein